MIRLSKLITIAEECWRPILTNNSRETGGIVTTYNAQLLVDWNVSDVDQSVFTFIEMVLLNSLRE